MITAEKTNIGQSFLAHFADFHVNEGHPALVARKRAALALLETMDFRTTRDERWKYTRVSGLLKQKYAAAHLGENINIAPFLIPNLDADLVVFVNGLYREDLSNVDGASEKVIITSLQKGAQKHPALVEKHFGGYAKDADSAFTATNTAYAQDGAFIWVAANTTVSKSIHILHLNTGTLAQPRHLIVAEQSSAVKVLQTFHSLEEIGLTNGLNEVSVAENARVNIELIQQEQTSCAQILTTQVKQHSDSVFAINTVTLKGKFVRNDLNILVDGSNCETHLNGVYLPAGENLIDNHTTVDHLQPHCVSHELYKGILDGKSTGVFNGKVFVRQDAQKTNAYQSNANILLSDDASMNSKPELEIYADDVKCSHGSTTGQFDEEAVFYLRSRGLSEDAARKMLLRAFTADVIVQISMLAVAEYVETLLAAKFNMEY